MRPLNYCAKKAGVIRLHDLTDTKRTTETVTAQEVYDLGHAKGVDDERAKTLDLLSAQEMAAGSEEERDAIWMLRAIIKSAGHWQERP
jgi:hypothetical protein